MKFNRISYALMFALAGSVALAACKKQEEAAVTTPPPAAEPMAPPPVASSAPVTATSVTVGNTAGADKTVAPTATFSPQDKIIVSVKTEGAATNTAINAKLTFQDGQVAGDQSATLNTAGMETTNVEFSNSAPWPAGKYNVDVTIDGQPAGTTQQIEVK
ncbi:MAG TPA: hypothetical protein VLF15_05825 [Pseudoxanthomonas sp.]|nr:hypothetical protein [Pseudoxanthomonas sp.]